LRKWFALNLYILLFVFVCLNNLGNINIKIMNMSLYAFDMRNASYAFITYDTGGTFTLENCLIRIAEPLAQWVSKSNSWNSTFMRLGSGTFVFDKSCFADIGVNTQSSCVISMNIGPGGSWTMTECEFGGGSLDDGGNAVYVASASLPSSGFTVNVSNCTFRSCYGGNGGVFRCDNYYD
jgi:hypothetical protein